MPFCPFGANNEFVYKAFKQKFGSFIEIEQSVVL